MGIIRGGALAVVSVLLLISIFASMLFLTMAWSLNYDNVKDNLGDVLKGELGNKIGLRSIIQDNFIEMNEYCESYSAYTIAFKNRIVVIPCEVIGEDPEAVYNYTIDEYIGKVYSEQYDCGFWKCFEEEQIPFFLVSAKAQAYWNQMFNYSFILIAVLAVLGFLFSQKKSNFFILTSVLIILSALPFAKIDWLFSAAGDTAGGFLGVFLSKGYAVFIRGAIFGGVLLLIGLILKLFRVGFKISTIFVKSNKEEELEKKEDELEKKEKIINKEKAFFEKKDEKKISDKENDKKSKKNSSKKKVVRKKVLKAKKK